MTYFLFNKDDESASIASANFEDASVASVASVTSVVSRLSHSLSLGGESIEIPRNTEAVHLTVLSADSLPSTGGIFGSANAYAG